MKVSAIVAALVLMPAQAKPIWQDITDANDPKGHGRRLELQTVSSHTNVSDAACIVGGFDDSNFNKVYIGGPCSKFNPTTMKALPGFRYVAMETIDVDLCNKDGCAEMKHVGEGSGFPVLQSQDLSTHAEVGSCGLFEFDTADIKKAGFFASTTSYLSKGSFTFSSNTFVVGKEGDTYSTLDVCIKNCCDPVPAEGCDCGGVCPTTTLSVEPGDFKYSLLSAAVDLEAESTKGWAKVVDMYGVTVDGTKQIQGKQYTYQVIDFTEMGADTITITPPAGSATTFSDMTACTPAQVEAGSGCTVAKVQTITMAANGWEGVSYDFPMYYNTGTWTKATSGALSATPGHSKQVVIEAIKFDDATMTTMLGSAYQAGTTKVMFLRYTFDISGITATDMTGKYMVYDPTVNTVTQAKAKAAANTASGTATGTATGTSTGASTVGTASFAPTSTTLSLISMLATLVNYLTQVD